jgi:MFS family permease
MVLIAYGEQISMAFGLAPAKENTTVTPEPPGVNVTAKKSTEHIPKDVFGFVVIFTASAILFMFLTHSWSPSRAYIADATTPESATSAISIYTFMSCLGSVLGGIVGGIDWSFIPLVRSFEDVYWWYYSVTIVVVFIAVLICCTAYKEVPLKSALTDADRPREENYQTFTTSEESRNQQPPGRRRRRETVTKDIILTDDADKSEGFSFAGYCISCCIMPRFLFVLYLCTLSGVCWYSFYYIFLTDYIGKVVFSGDPSTPHNSILHDKYVEGIRQGSFCMAIDAATAACHAFFSMAIVEKVGKNEL